MPNYIVTQCADTNTIFVIESDDNNNQHPHCMYEGRPSEATAFSLTTKTSSECAEGEQLMVHRCEKDNMVFIVKVRRKIWVPKSKSDKEPKRLRKLADAQLVSYSTTADLSASDEELISSLCN